MNHRFVNALDLNKMVVFFPIAIYLVLVLLVVNQSQFIKLPLKIGK